MILAIKPNGSKLKALTLKRGSVMRRVLTVVLSMLIAVAVFPAESVADSHDDVAKKIMDLAYAQWEAFNKRDVAGAMKQVADEYTEFNPVAATRIDGKALNTRMAEAGSQDSSENILAEMLNPKVQVYGNVAILSYNYMGMTKDKEGKTTPNRAKSTRVYVNKDDKWMLVHANFGADPVAD